MYQQKQTNKFFIMRQILESDFLRVKGDMYGNPRYVIHYLKFQLEGESITFAEALARAKQIGGKTYRGKEYGGGIVFQSYSLPHTIQYIEEVLNKVKQENK